MQPDQVHHGLTTLELERARVVTRLRTECTEGRISLDRFSDLVGDAYAATSTAQLQPVLAAVAAVAPAAPVAPGGPETGARAARPRPRPRANLSRWLVAVFGENTRTGRYRLEDEASAAAVFGECTLDLSQATIESARVIVNAVAVFGDVTVIVPPGVDIAIEGASVFGSRRCDVTPSSLGDDAPVIVVRAWACFGDVRIRSPRAATR